MFCKLEQESLSRMGRQFGQPLGDDYVGDPVSEAAITGAALVRHLDDVRFATLRALRQLLRALDAERIAIGLLSPDGERLKEELVWVSGFGRCGESERVVSCASFSDELRIWLASREDSVSIGIDARSPAWHELPCDQLLLVRGGPTERAQPCPVLVAQLRGGTRLREPAAQAISILLKEYVVRRAAAAQN